MSSVNRIFCIGRNYAEHVRELGNEPSDSCVVFMKPASAVVAQGQVIALPNGIGSIHHEAELVVRLSGGGRQLSGERALDFVDAITLGLDLTARDLQSQLKAKGLPWERAKSFDGSAPLGDWRPRDGLELQDLQFQLTVNGELRQSGHTANMIFSVARQLEIISQLWALQAGDIVFTGTPAGVAALAPGDQLELSSAQIGCFRWSCN